MKLFYVIISIITLSFTSDFVNSFDEEVNKAYSEYIVLDEYENQYYSVKIVYGLLDEKIRYGVCFYSIQPKEYYLNIIYQNKVYEVKTNPRGDISAIALDIKEGETFSVAIFDRDDHQQYPFSSFSNITAVSKDDFDQISNVQIGQGLGASLSELQLKSQVNLLQVIVISSIVIILFCGIVLFFYYRNKKGMFEPGNLKEGVFDFKAFINESFPNTIDETNFQKDDDDEEDDDDEHHNIKSEDSYGVYEGDKPYQSVATYKWVRQDDEKSNFNIRNHLIDLGLVADYWFASVDEKNKIMLELMRLKDTNQITKDDYLEEVAKLWKN